MKQRVIFAVPTFTVYELLRGPLNDITAFEKVTFVIKDGDDIHALTTDSKEACLLILGDSEPFERVGGQSPYRQIRKKGLDGFVPKI